MSSSSVAQLILRVDLPEQVHKVFAREVPVEGRCHGRVVLMEAQQSLLNFFKTYEVVGGQHLALNDGEIDFDLVEPAGVDRAVNRHQVGKGSGQPLNAARSAMRRAIVDDPEDPAGIAVRRL